MQDYLKKSLTNINGSPKTTIIGAIFVLGSCYAAWSQEQTTNLASFEAMVFMVGVGLLFAKDKEGGEDE